MLPSFRFRLRSFALAASLVLTGHPPAFAEDCPGILMPAKPVFGTAAHSAPPSTLIAQYRLDGPARDQGVVAAIRDGQTPSFLNRLQAVRAGGTVNGQEVEVIFCVTPDYLSIGQDRDYLRMPMGLPAARAIAGETGFVMPTARMVSLIHAQAENRLAPSPMTPGPQMTSLSYILAHDATIDAQMRGRNPARLTSGGKKDLVASNRLLAHTTGPRGAFGRVAIFGWHRSNGRPIQPLSTVHGATYADYSHGLRLVAPRALLNGRTVDLLDILSAPGFASLLSQEGILKTAYLATPG